MVLLDHSLIYSAQRITTGANIHRVGNLLFAYEQAVALHNGGYKGHKEYQRKHEDLLRQYVAIHCLQYSKTKKIAGGNHLLDRR
jgi:hypothetical protein